LRKRNRGSGLGNQKAFYSINTLNGKKRVWDGGASLRERGEGSRSRRRKQIEKALQHLFSKHNRLLGGDGGEGGPWFLGSSWLKCFHQFLYSEKREVTSGGDSESFLNTKRKKCYRENHGTAFSRHVRLDVLVRTCESNNVTKSFIFW